MITELTWRDLTPRLVVDENPTPIVGGQSVCFALSKVRHCVGYIQLGVVGHIACPASAEIQPGKESQCESCKQRDVSFTAKTGFGTSEQAAELLSADHVVYLAYFSDDIIKVGVALASRKEVRVSEQGALACMFVGYGNGTVARNLERRIHNVAGFTEWVRLDTKLKALRDEPDEATCRKVLTESYEKAKRLAGSAAMSDTPEFLFLYPRYRLGQNVFAQDMSMSTEVAPGARIGGVITGVIGKVILIGIGDETLAVNTALLAGYSLEKPLDSLCHDVQGVTTKKLDIDRQQSLFGLL